MHFAPTNEFAEPSPVHGYEQTGPSGQTGGGGVIVAPNSGIEADNGVGIETDAGVGIESDQ